MAEQPDKQENSLAKGSDAGQEGGLEASIEVEERGIGDAEPLDTSEPAPDVQADDTTSDTPKEVSNDLDDILNDSIADDNFDEIDLFDEGLLDEIDAGLETDQEKDVVPDDEDKMSDNDSSVDSPVEEEPSAAESGAAPSEDATADKAEVSSSSDVNAESVKEDFAAHEVSTETDSSTPQTEVPNASSPTTSDKEDPSGKPLPDGTVSEGAIEDEEDFSEAEEILAGLNSVDTEESYDPSSDAADEIAAPEPPSGGEPDAAADISLEVEEKAAEKESSPEAVPEEPPSEPSSPEPASAELTSEQTPEEQTPELLGDAPEPDAESKPSEPQSTSADTDAFGDDLGISLSDDELWDDSSEDDIPLFEDELEEPMPYGPGAKAPSKDTAAEPATSDEKGDESHLPSDNEQKRESAEVVSQDQDTTQASQHDTRQGGDEDTDLLVVSFSVPEWVPYFISGVASMILIGGIFVLWGMISSLPTSDQAETVSKIDVTKRQGGKADTLVQEKSSGSVPSEAGSLHEVSHIKGGQSVETFNLAPFIIPVMRQGELVFFKLTVELIVPDMKTKQELKKREAWVRDAIYTELKGIEVGPGTKGEFLLNYRRPLKKRIEKELAPLEIRDVRLMGYVLK